MKKILTNDELNYIINNYGIIKADDIAETLNINRKTLYKIIKENNIQSAKTQLDYKLVKTDYLENYLSVQEIADKYNVTKNKVITFLHDNNISKTKDDILNSKKATNLKKFGTEWATKNKDISDKIKQTNIERYGVSNVSQVEAYRDKAKQTNIERYGVDNYAKTEMYKEQLKNNTTHRSLKYYLENTNVKQDYLNIWMNDDAFIEFIKDNKGLTIQQLSNIIGITDEPIRTRIHNLDLIDYVSMWKHPSKYEDEIYNILVNKGITDIERGNTTILNGKEIDLYIPSLNVGIEFNGNYFHSEVEKENTYHQNKTLLAKSKGVFIYNIFEYEWLVKKDIILNQLFNILQLNTNKIYARKCEIRLVNKQDKDEFLNNNHLQGKSASKYNIGLYYNNELVSLMTFGISRFNKSCRYELIRFCSKAGCNVIGGANRLFKYFTDNYMIAGDKLVSYSDMARTRGTLYETLGFENNGYDYPNYVWWKTKSEIKTRYQCQIKNEIDTMHKLGYLRIFDCGSITWIYTK